ncbi:IS66 family transposase [Thiocapsa rosea]|uniref:Transposase n=1 Tax=Thiocapsa rosea TaxID=69360 RepID=A0A495V4V0_9GAMM|nr:IS66 family transposase [Thiocapsa rosea]RKT43357.1 transposase [Thiocapsa rosea]
MPKTPPTTDRPDSKDAELTRLRAQNAEQAKQIAELLQRIRDLEARLGKDSHNSSKPPSSDPPFKKPPPRSRRVRSGMKPGGQKDHPGATRALVEDPEHRIVMPLEGLCGCGRDCAELAVEVLPERRQVIDLVVHREVTEYRAVTGVCACGQVHRSAFPEAVGAPVQYGPGLSALAVYLTDYQNLPYRRSAELIGVLAGITLSPATLLNMGRKAAARLAAPVAAIGQSIVRSAVAHADETGMRVAGALQWLHVLSTSVLTFYAVHAKRGAEALTGIGLLDGFRGILVHDHWRAYLSIPARHAFCNAHHLRELIALAEADPVLSWPKQLIALLCEANDATIAARAAGLEALPDGVVKDVFTRYDTILADGVFFHPQRLPPPGSRRRVKQTPAYNLVARLRTHRDEVLRFVTDLRVPFDNNQAERDLRMPKLKQKVSGCFRAPEGAAAFATVRSYLSTLRKQSIDLYPALVMTFRGQPPMPRLP